MTAQLSDRIRFEGRTRPLSCEPLYPWLERKKNRRLRFRATSSACWRGYRAAWEVHRGRLYLTSFKARLRNGRFAGVNTLFENYSEQFYESCGANDPKNDGPGKFAFWCTGVVSCYVGRLLTYKHFGYGSVCEAELQLTFKDGLLVGQRIVHHEPEPEPEFDDSLTADLDEP